MPTTFTETVVETFKVVSCYTCSVRFGITAELYKRVVTDANGSVSCPACGNKTCWRESEDQKRIKELERKLQWEANEAARQKALRESAQASLRATQGVVTKLKTRVAVGVCPCCHRTFKQLSAHMAKKHPAFVEDAAQKPA
jgi:hypothetical protein